MKSFGLNGKKFAPALARTYSKVTTFLMQCFFFSINSSLNYRKRKVFGMNLLVWNFAIHIQRSVNCPLYVRLFKNRIISYAHIKWDFFICSLLSIKCIRCFWKILSEKLIILIMKSWFMLFILYILRVFPRQGIPWNGLKLVQDF